MVLPNDTVVFEHAEAGVPPLEALRSHVEDGSEPTQAVNRRLQLTRLAAPNSHICYALTVRGSNPAFPEAFLASVAAVYNEYALGGSAKASMCEAIGEMVTAQRPYTTDVAAIRSMVPQHRVLASFIASAQELVNSIVGDKRQPPVFRTPAEPAPLWRPQAVKHTNNEIYVDMEEAVECMVVPRRLKQAQGSVFYSTGHRTATTTLAGSISGRVVVTLKLSGMPLLHLVIARNGVDLSLHALHASVDRERFAQLGVALFIPPDGRLTLVEYTIPMDRLLVRPGRATGVDVDCVCGLGASGNEFEVRLSGDGYGGTSGGRQVEGMVVEVHALAPTVLVKSSRVTHGDLRSRGDGVAVWLLGPSVGLAQLPVLRGTVHGGTITHVRATFTTKGHLALGMKVESVRVVSGLDVKPYKGVKYIVRGDVTVRAQ